MQGSPVFWTLYFTGNNFDEMGVFLCAQLCQSDVWLVEVCKLGALSWHKVDRRAVTVGARVRYCICPCESFDRQSGAGTSFPTGALVFPSHYQSTIAP
jgi:hypothetical protein